jgi:phosphate uptake regulator
MRLLIAAIMSVLLAGCTTFQPPTNFADSLGLAYITVDAVAETAHAACRNEVSLGPCAPDAPLDTETKEDIRMALEHVLDSLDHARDLYVQGRADVAQDRLAQAQTLLRSVQSVLQRYGRSE